MGAFSLYVNLKIFHKTNKEILSSNDHSSILTMVYMALATVDFLFVKEEVDQKLIHPGTDVTLALPLPAAARTSKLIG